MRSPRQRGGGPSRAGAARSLGGDTQHPIAPAIPLAQRRRHAASKGRAATIAALIPRMTARLGRAPTDAELAEMLAVSEAGIARVRRQVERGEE